VVVLEKPVAVAEDGVVCIAEMISGAIRTSSQHG
jgi:hypothetical protein